MTVEVKPEAPRGRITLIGDGSTGDPVADLTALCRSVAELARTTTRPPSRIRLEHLGTAVEVEWATAAAHLTAEQPAAEPAGGLIAAEDGAHHVGAPMVGTFYRSPEPGAPPFVAVGDTVTPGQPIGILEVMKMMSPVEADVAGRVVEILVDDGASVEFQQPLIAVEPV
ncbi:acetyl-CoA carboxylase biotin carboxyl carrier protein [Streptomyces sp. TLI_171]|uniref:acetyl-CoA carboxylase biotin carboxyl carrier protein n=1 Tax=Streptomyces sp. TLI_171 TaxID=1938859 RepID=UPI000C17FB44|nr:acetyl-CoA carboxylase biotin carboxyl carrier protein [Streptomyces sp. TLI_171]RKE23212.1 acetyl-CoA carboxylase biotin carboxyl carrier protein [Streptomyces sp. TLI_171]